MENDISKDSFLYTLERIFNYAKEASDNARKSKDPFSQGVSLAYDQISQVIENELNGLGIDINNL